MDHFCGNLPYLNVIVLALPCLSPLFPASRLTSGLPTTSDLKVYKHYLCAPFLELLTDQLRFKSVEFKIKSGNIE